MYNGNFYIDDVNLEILTNDKKWKSIYRIDFEKGIDDWKQGTGRGNSGINNLFKGEVSTVKAKSGNQCFNVYGKEVPNYGTNNKVGKYSEINGIKLYNEVYGEGTYACGITRKRRFK